MNTITQKIREQVLARDLNGYDLHAHIRTNQLGYLPAAPKFAVLETEETLLFRLIDCVTGETADEREVCPARKDFGWAAEYCFSHVTRPGTYYIRAGMYRSYPVRIGAGVWEDAYKPMVTYFAAQRCGPSTTGYMSPCHCEDGIRKDNGQHQDVTGGWHDASDLRKWVEATLYGMVGLSAVYELQGDVAGAGAILEELQWGNRYFLHMQEPEGYVMGHCGGDVFRHADSNHWTDNIPGTDDDRVIETDPADMSTQLRFVQAQAMTARVARAQGEADYAAVCLAAAQRCLAWTLSRLGSATTVETWGQGALALAEMYITTGDAVHLDTAASMADRVLALQVHDYAPVRGFFRTSEEKDAPYRNFIMGDPVGLGLCRLLEAAPDHARADAWRACLREWAEDYIIPMAAGSGYGLMPYALYEYDAGGGRRCGDTYYFRYFYGLRDKGGWMVGINAHAAAIGLAMAKAGVLLDMPACLDVAMRQLDWIVGSNPFDACTIDLVGRNRHSPYIPGAFVPGTPRIRGAVLNGIAGNAEDMPDMFDGTYHTCEYWTPMVCFTMYLAAWLDKKLG